MPKLTVMRGLPGSGKSTLAKQLAKQDGNSVRLNRDEMREMMFAGQPWSGKQERIVEVLEKVMITRCLAQNKNVVLDNCNLHRSAAEWQAWLEQEITPAVAALIGGEPHNRLNIVDLTGIKVDECIKRDLGRQGKARVGRGVIERMALRRGLIDLSQYEKVAIIDIDGTVADCDHRLHYINTEKQKKDYHSFYSKVGRDTGLWGVISAVNKLSDSGHTILFVSGRPGVLVEDPNVNVAVRTSEWLESHGLEFKHLFMRRGGDYRVDHVVKAEILHDMVTYGKLDKQAIKCVIDDRDSIIALWAENGLPWIKVDHDEAVAGDLELAKQLSIPIKETN